MNMVWHYNPYGYFGVWVMCHDILKLQIGITPYFIQLHFTVNHVTEKMVTVSGTDCDKIQSAVVIEPSRTR